MSFRDLGLRAELLRAVETQGYTVPTPVQSEAIPAVLSGVDVLAGAQTGTGKTAAFALPILQRLAERSGNSRFPRVLVLAPTRELASQIGDSFAVYGQYLPQRTTVVFGGVGIQPQIDQLRRGTDVLVATPGRLLDHAGRKTLDLGQVEVLVLDEADRMLDMGFIPDIRRVLRLLPAKRQNLFFSATFPESVQELADDILRQPTRIQVSPRNAAAENVNQIVHHVPAQQKRALLSHLIQTEGWSQVLVFTRTKHGANRLAKQLVSDGIEAEAIHGNKSQSARTRALSGFKAGRVRALIATDIASRGIDIDQLPHVVNFDLPNIPEDYVHRIGRTGRAGVEGTARSLVSAEERAYLRDIERLLRRSIPVQEVSFPSRPVTAEPAPAPNHRPQRGENSRPARPASSQPRGNRPSARPAATPQRDSRPAAPQRSEGQPAQPARPARRRS
ncbi:MAG: DEAD/DEAH box helicase, partial [Lentisphaeria bacterium]|nr:DEAD/DEAH box helicase [Lentisphaeria bacterium]